MFWAEAQRGFVPSVRFLVLFFTNHFGPLRLYVRMTVSSPLILHQSCEFNDHRSNKAFVGLIGPNLGKVAFGKSFRNTTLIRIIQAP